MPWPLQLEGTISSADAERPPARGDGRRVGANGRTRHGGDKHPIRKLISIGRPARHPAGFAFFALAPLARAQPKNRLTARCRKCRTYAVTVFLHQVARTRTIPFVIGDTAPPERRWTGFADGAEAWRVFERGRAMRLARGAKPWTMDEINAEIDAMHASGETPIAKAAML